MYVVIASDSLTNISHLDIVHIYEFIALQPYNLDLSGKVKVGHVRGVKGV